MILILPNLYSWLSLPISILYDVLEFGPKIMGAPVSLLRVKWPLTKSAWKCVSKMNLIFELFSSAIEM